MKTEKRCPSCSKREGKEVVLPASEFRSAPSRGDGLSSICAPCDRERQRAKHAEKSDALVAAARARVADDYATLKPGDEDPEGYTAPGYDKEKKHEYSAAMGKFASASHEPASAVKIAESLRHGAEAERRWINKRLARSHFVGASRETLLAQQFEQVAERVCWPVAMPRRAPKVRGLHTKRAVVAPLSDLHFGGTLHGYENPVAFDFLSASRGLAKVMEQIAEYKTQYRDQTELVLGFNGDVIEGMLGWNDADNAPLAEQMVAFGHAAVCSIRFAREHFSRVRVVMRPGNHGRNKLSHPGRATSSKWNSFETVIYKFVAMQCRALEGVTFDVARSPVAVVPLFDRNMLMTHADTELNLKSPSSSGGKASWGRAIQSVNADLRYGAHIDLLWGGHFHDPTIMIFDKGVAVCQGALTPSNGHSRTGGFESVMGQFIFEAVPGFVFGDSRFVRTGPDVFRDSALDAVIPPFDFDSVEAA